MLLGYAAIFLPIFALIYPVPQKIKRHGGIICVSVDMLILIVLLSVCLYGTPKMLLNAILTSIFVFVPVVAIVAMFSYWENNLIFKFSILSAFIGIFSFIGNSVINAIFAIDYRLNIDLTSWQSEHINDNILLLILIAFLIASLVLAIIGTLKKLKNK